MSSDLRVRIAGERHARTLALALQLTVRMAREELAKDGEVSAGAWEMLDALTDALIQAQPKRDRLRR